MPVPLFATSLDAYQERIAETLADVARSGRYILGPQVEAFEEEFARYLGVRHVIGVGNGTDALTIALRALGVERGDEVVLPSLTFYATAEAAVNAGATPVFCDVDPNTFCVTRESVERVMGERTKAVIPVDLFGNVAPDLGDLGVPVLEDAAQAAGARLGARRAGSLGSAATFSFFPSKNLPCLGDGGAIATDDDEVAATARLLRFHGSVDKGTFQLVGYNSRLDAMQAAVLRLLLSELDGWNEKRRSVAEAYQAEGLGDHVQLPRSVDSAEHVYHLYVVKHERPDELAQHLAKSGIQARGYYRVPVHQQPGMKDYGGGAELPGTMEAARTNVALPMGPELSREQIAEVVAAVASLD